tara:strand:- start:37055 stop:37384 length:330 start_codon:yes stop_codon:yes gene_type:complete
MFNFAQKVQAFLKENYAPATVNDATLTTTTTGLLELLTEVYPRHSVDSFELYDILHRLGYQEQLYRKEHKHAILDDEGNKTGNFTIKYTEHIGWLLKSIKTDNVLAVKT